MRVDKTLILCYLSLFDLTLCPLTRTTNPEVVMLHGASFQNSPSPATIKPKGEILNPAAKGCLLIALSPLLLLVFCLVTTVVVLAMGYALEKSSDGVMWVLEQDPNVPKPGR